MGTGSENVEAEGGFRLRWDVLGECGRLAVEGRLSMPVARTFTLEEWREALKISLSGRARGRMILLLEKGVAAVVWLNFRALDSVYSLVG